MSSSSASEVSSSASEVRRQLVQIRKEIREYEHENGLKHTYDPAPSSEVTSAFTTLLADEDTLFTDLKALEDKGDTWVQLFAEFQWWWSGTNLTAIFLFWFSNGMVAWQKLHLKIVCLVSIVCVVLNVVVSSRQSRSDWVSKWRWHICTVLGCWVWFLQFSHEHFQGFKEENYPEN